MLLRLSRRAVFAAAFFWFLVPTPAISADADAVLGSVTTTDGVPVANATVTLLGNGVKRIARTDSTGTFGLKSLPPGTYSLSAAARGFDRLSGRSVDVRENVPTHLTLVLYQSVGSLTVIGSVRGRGTGDGLSTSSGLSRELDAQTYSARGYASVADILSEQAIAATVIRTASGNPASPIAVALRGPDPTETLIDIDGHAVNSGGTGAFDLTELDPASLSGIQLIYGVSPSSLIGPNTIDGAINVRTLDPTVQAHSLARVGFGSFGAFSETLQATGAHKGLGYALALHHAYTQGQTNQFVSGDDGSQAFVGSAMGATSALAKLNYAMHYGGFVALDIRDQSENRDLSAALTSETVQPGSATTYTAFSGSSLLSHNSGYGIDVGSPLGREDADGIAPANVLFRHLTSSADQSVSGPAAGSTPYLYNDRDIVFDDSLEYDLIVPKGTVSAKISLRSESLDTQTVDVSTTDQSVGRRVPFSELDNATLPAPTALSGLGQTQRSFVVRYEIDPTVHLHYSLATYYSSFSSFGTSVDPRFGVAWTPSARSTVRFSVGSTFQAPQLPELYVPEVLPSPDANGYVDIGNANLKADRATDFDAGYEHIFAGANPAKISLDLYQTNLRAPSQRYYPATPCPPAGTASPSQCLSYPINIGGAVYRGMQFYLERAVARRTTVRVAYGVSSSFATAVSPEFQNGSIVPGEQFQGAPLHKAMLEITHDPTRGVGFNGGLTYEDADNELNRPAFATLHAGLTWRVRQFDLGLYGTNLTNVYADRFTLAGQGVPYGGIDGPIPSDAYSLQGRSIQCVLSLRD